MNVFLFRVPLAFEANNSPSINYNFFISQFTEIYNTPMYCIIHSNTNTYIPDTPIYLNFKHLNIWSMQFSGHTIIYSTYILTFFQIFFKCTFSSRKKRRKKKQEKKKKVLTNNSFCLASRRYLPYDLDLYQFATFPKQYTQISWE